VILVLLPLTLPSRSGRRDASPRWKRTALRNLAALICSRGVHCRQCNSARRRERLDKEYYRHAIPDFQNINIG